MLFGACALSDGVLALIMALSSEAFRASAASLFEAGVRLGQRRSLARFRSRRRFERARQRSLAATCQLKISGMQMAKFFFRELFDRHDPVVSASDNGQQLAEFDLHRQRVQVDRG